MTIDYILYELSYSNLVLYSSVLPSYNDNGDEVLDGDDPRNREKIRKLLYE